VVPENIHTPPTEGTGISSEMEGSMRTKKLYMKLNWNFQRGRDCVRKSPFCGGGMDIF